MKEIKVIELFGGIGALTQALKRTGIPHKIVDYVEIDKYAVASYNAMNGTNYEPQDICNWDKDIEVDLIMHGSPCQDFSLAGKNLGGDKDSGTRSSLMYETIRIVEKLKPQYVIWENVKNLLSKKHRHNFDAYLEKMEELGYTNYYQVLNAKDYGIPQNRERVFTISILNKTNCSEELTKLLGMFENTDDEDFLRKGKIKYEIFNKYGVDKKCFRCGSQLLISDLPNYKYLCFECDENMYEFEAIDFKFPEKKTLEKYMIDYLENEVDDKYNVGEKRLEIIKNNLGNVFEDNFIIGSSQKNAFVGNESICPTLTTAMATGGGQVPMIKYVFPPKQELKLKLKDMLEDEVDEKYYLSEKAIKGRLETTYQKYKLEENCINNKEVHPTILARFEGAPTLYKEENCEIGLYDHTSSDNFANGKRDYGYRNEYGTLKCTPKYSIYKSNDSRIRKLTPKECWRLMGFDDEDFEKAAKVNSNSQLYKQAGNSIVVNVLECIIKNLLKDKIE